MGKRVPKVSVIIIGYKSKRYIDSCMKSIKSQSFFGNNQIEIIYIDNGSNDGSIDIVKRHFKWVRTLQNIKNIGYPGALNQGIHYSSGDYVLIMNPDVILEKDYIEKAVIRMERDKSYAAVCGKIYQYDFNRSEKLPNLDSVGYFAFMDMQLLTAFGSQDFGQFEDITDILSVTNTCAMYRRSALSDAKTKIGKKEEYFDKSFFMHLEDVDMCWRLRLLGWKIAFIPFLVSYHLTDFRKEAINPAMEAFKKKIYLRNKCLMIVKNVACRQIFKGFFTFIKCFIVSFRTNIDDVDVSKLKMEFYTQAKASMSQKLSKAYRKRKFIQKRKRIGCIKMKRWFLSKHSTMYVMYRSKNLLPFEKIKKLL